ncbi:MAG: ABC transporter permease [Nanoarchaeota archaeon]
MIKMLKDIAKYVSKNVFGSITRSSLTILSITMGIMAIFALLSFGQGLTKYVEDISEEMGTQNIIVQPRGTDIPGSSSDPLDQEDLEFLRKQSGVVDATPFTMRMGQVKKDEDGSGKHVYVTGMTTKSGEFEFAKDVFAGFEIEEGRYLEKDARGEAVLGNNYKKPQKIFENPVEIRDKIYVNGKKFDVVGFFEPLGNPQDDANVMTSLEDAEALFDVKEEYDMIYLKAEKAESPSELADYLKEKLRNYKEQDEGQEDFSITTLESQLDTFNTIIALLNGILVAIAGVSVFVAAVNIANTMYTSVIERTKEIGVMKAIGARNSYIAMIFMGESGILGLLGGVIGISLGYGVAVIGGRIAEDAGYGLLTPYFPLWLIIGCLLFAFGVGALSGLLPALQAAKLKPVDALREE